MRTWKIVAIIYSMIGVVFISTVNLDNDPPTIDTSPRKETTVTYRNITPKEMIVPPVGIPMRSLTYPSKILGYYYPRTHYMVPQPQLDRYQQAVHDSTFYADELAQ